MSDAPIIAGSKVRILVPSAPGLPSGLDLGNGVAVAPSLGGPTTPALAADVLGTVMQAGKHSALVVIDNAGDHITEDAPDFIKVLWTIAKPVVHVGLDLLEAAIEEQAKK